MRRRSRELRRFLRNSVEKKRTEKEWQLDGEAGGGGLSLFAFGQEGDKQRRGRGCKRQGGE